MATTHSRVVLVGTLALLALAAGPARAGAPTDQLRVHIDRVIKTLDDPALKGEGKAEQRRGTVRTVASEIFDVPETARRALGTHWQARTPTERDEFARLFGDLLEHAYIGKIDRYEGEQIKYGAESIEGQQAVVRTRIVTKQGTEIPVDYRMHQRNGRWLVYDVMIEGVSLVGNYRTQFNKIIQSGSYADLVQRLKAKSVAPSEDSKGRRS
jgi:phospholipid transport system substrate-binding protein